MQTTARKARTAARRAAIVLAATALIAGVGSAAQAAPAGTPKGNFESAAGSAQGIELKGWALDPDTKNSVYVWVTVDGQGRHVYANAARPDIDRAFPGFGAKHGVAGTIAATPGSHSVCVTVSNVGAGAHQSLGCKTVNVPGAAKAAQPVQQAAQPVQQAAQPVQQAAATATATVTNAAVQSSARPDASNTGVPAGTRLTRHNGDLVVTQAGAVIDSLDVYGTISVRADNVVIKNTRIRGKAATNNVPLISMNKGNRNLRVMDTEIAPDNPSPYQYGVMGWEFTLERVNIHHVVDSAHIYGPNVTIKSSWLHDNVHYTNDPNFGGTPTHDDGVQIQKGSNIRIIGNRIEGMKNVSVMITQDQGRTSDVQLIGNWIDGGGCSLNIAEKGKGSVTGLVAKDNTFGRNTKHVDCAMITPKTSPINASGNVYTDGKGATVRAGS